MSNKENKQKRVPKTMPSLSIKLNEEQQKVEEDFLKYDVNFIMGDYASGKTACSAAIALNAFNRREYNNIVITRPIVKNSLGFLPGLVEEKMKPWVSPIVHNLNMCQGKEKTDKMMQDGTIEILPIDFAKGITYVESIVIVDEFVDMNYEDFRTMLTRLGKNSKIIFCGSKEQVDRSVGKYSCISTVEKLRGSGIVGYNNLKSNHRNPILTEIIKLLEA